MAAHGPADYHDNLCAARKMMELKLNLGDLYEQNADNFEQTSVTASIENAIDGVIAIMYDGGLNCVTLAPDIIYVDYNNE